MSPRHNLPPERLLQGQQVVLEMVASGNPLDQSLRAKAEFSESSLPEMRAPIPYDTPPIAAYGPVATGVCPSPSQKAVDGLVPGARL